MFYRLVQSFIAFVLRRFYQVRIQGQLPRTGPLLLVGNHPNALIDPALVFALTDRPVTFLAKEPLFRTPVIGMLLRGLDALPVYRRQDAENAGQMGKNEGTLDAAAQALEAGRVIMIFPEGKSHSEPALAELKTGAARIAFKAAKAGAQVQVVPIGLTYEKKNRFRSAALIDVGSPVSAAGFLASAPEPLEAEKERVHRFTAELDAALRGVTLNLAQWEDLPLIETGEALYALRRGEPSEDAARRRRFARGMQLLRAEQPERFEHLRAEVASFRRRLLLVKADPADLELIYQRVSVTKFVLRNLGALLFGFPLFFVGLLLFAVPFWLGRGVGALLHTAEDTQATVKFLATVLLGPLWLALLTFLAWHFAGPAAGVLALVFTLPLALFTRYFFEHRRSALRDARVFFVLGSRGSLKARLLAEGERLAKELEEVAEELGARL